MTPRLLLNKEFIEEYCSTDGDLFLLILHELHHVILGHTRLFPRGNKIDNIVFDAVINSMLARSVGQSVGVKLFTSTNSGSTLRAGSSPPVSLAVQRVTFSVAGSSE